MIISTTRGVFIREEMSVYFSLELPISEENRSIHDNFTETPSRISRGEATRRKRSRSRRLRFMRNYSRWYARERRKRSAIGRTKKTH